MATKRSATPTNQRSSAHASTCRGLKHFGHRTAHHFMRAFVPHAGNHFQPHALRPKALSAYAVGLIVVKLAVTTLLFAIYPNPGFFSTATASRFLDLTNAARQQAGVTTLTVNPKLSTAAARHAQDILDRGYFAHTTPDGKKFWQWMKDEKYQFSFAGENLALDFADAEVAQDALMNSPGHRANILNNRFTQVGFAVRTGEFEGRTTTVLVEMFAKPLPVVTRPVKAPALPPAKSKTTTPTPAPKPTVAAATEPAFDAILVSESTVPLDLKTGDARVVSMRAINRGSETWTVTGDHSVSLTTLAPLGRTSALATNTWVSPSQPATMTPATVKPGETATWTFTIAAPTTPGAYIEQFGLRTASDVLDRAGMTLSATVQAPVIETQPTSVTANPTDPQVPTDGTPVDPSAPTTESVTPTGAPAAITTTPALQAVTEPVKSSHAALARGALATSTNLFLFFLVFLTVALFMNVIVRYEVQHRHIILGVVMLMLFTAGMLVVGFHFLDLGSSPLVIR